VSGASFEQRQRSEKKAGASFLPKFRRNERAQPANGSVDLTKTSGLKTPSYRTNNARSFGHQPPALPVEGKSGVKVRPSARSGLPAEPFAIDDDDIGVMAATRPPRSGRATAPDVGPAHGASDTGEKMKSAEENDDELFPPCSGNRP